MRQTFSPHFVEMLAWYWCEVSISTLQFFIVPALDIWILPSWDVHFISVWLHPPICLNKAVQPSGGGKQGGGVSYTHILNTFMWRPVSTFYLSTMSPLDIRGEVCGFWFLAVLIPGTPTRKGRAFGVSKTEWSKPHPTPLLQRWGTSHFPMQDHFCKAKKTPGNKMVLCQLMVL